MFIRYNFIIIRYIYAAQIGSGFGSSQISISLGFDRVGFRLSDHLEFRVVRVRIESGLKLSDLGSSRISNRSGSNQVRFESL
jgi:hypothetical protein